MVICRRRDCHPLRRRLIASPLPQFSKLLSLIFTGSNVENVHRDRPYNWPRISFHRYCFFPPTHGPTLLFAKVRIFPQSTKHFRKKMIPSQGISVISAISPSLKPHRAVPPRETQPLSLFTHLPSQFSLPSRVLQTRVAAHVTAYSTLAVSDAMPGSQKTSPGCRLTSNAIGFRNLYDP